MQSAGLNSLNHDIMASYPLRVTPISQNLGQPSAGVSAVCVCVCVSWSPVKGVQVVKHAIPIANSCPH